MCDEHAAVGERLRRLAQRVHERVVVRPAVADALREPLEPQCRPLEPRQPRPAALGHRLAAHRRDPHLEREDEPLAHQCRARLLALEPGRDEPGPQLPGQRRLVQGRRRPPTARARGRGGARPSIGEVAKTRDARPRDQQPRGRVEVDAVRRGQARPGRRTRSAATRTPARTRARTRPATRSPRPRPPRTASPRPRSCHAARSSSSRRRSATGDSPVAALSSRSRWSREKCTRPASEAPLTGSSSDDRTTSISSRRRSAIRTC